MDDNGHITLDTSKIQGLNLADLSPDEIQSLISGAGEQAREEVEENDATLTLGALGGTYEVGPVDMTIAMGNIVLLHEINSPFITGDVGEEGEPLDSVECVRALYVLAKGREALKPIMSMKQRIQAVMMLKPMVEGNPSLMDKLLDRVERMAEAEARFTESAMTWYEETFIGYDFQEIVDSMFLALNDVMKIANDMPSDDSKKK